MRSFKTDGIIIKRINFNDADRILTVFTKDYGKMSIKASGIRRITSRRGAHVELLNHATLSLYRGKALPVLTEAQMITSHADIKSDLDRVGLAYHICELVDGLCPENQENYAVYVLLQQTLHKLSSEENIIELVHGFEVELLSILGYWNSSEKTVGHSNTHAYIESILERKLKSRKIFSKLNN